MPVNFEELIQSYPLVLSRFNNFMVSRMVEPPRDQKSWLNVLQRFMKSIGYRAEIQFNNKEYEDKCIICTYFGADGFLNAHIEFYNVEEVWKMIFTDVFENAEAWYQELKKNKMQEVKYSQMVYER